MNHSVPKDSFRRSHKLTRSQLLRSYDHQIQQYGTLFHDYAWQVYGTGTFSRKTTVDGANRLFRQFMSRLRQSLKSTAIAYIGVLERRTSGLGMPAIPAHWHFLLAAAPQHRAALLQNARTIWQERFGFADVREYDKEKFGAYYVAKLAGGANFDFLMGGLDRFDRAGSDDYYERFQSDTYVPGHVKHMTHGETLRLERG